MNTRSLILPVTNLPPEGLTVSVELTSAQLDLPQDERLGFVDPINLSLNISSVGNSILARGNGTVSMRGSCDRCLDVFTRAVTLDDICHYHEEVQEETVDLTEEIREDILIVLPQRLLCRENCPGLCSKCGRKLSSEPCECGGGETGEVAWSPLDRLREQLNDNE